MRRSVLFFTASVFCLILRTSAPVTMAAEAAPQADAPKIVFLVSDDPSNYKSCETIPVFADMLRKQYGCDCTVLKREGELSAARFPGLEKAIDGADLLVIFFRRCAPPKTQLSAIRNYLAAGKPLVGVRTANHGFAARGAIAEGHAGWETFCSEVLGCGNVGYGPGELGVDVRAVAAAASHPILAGVTPTEWHGNGQLYLVKPIDPAATVLLTGSVQDKQEPVAWTRMYKKSRVFYTSLGFPTDFDLPQFRTLLANAVFWAMERPAPALTASH